MAKSKSNIDVVKGTKAFTVVLDAPFTTTSSGACDAGYLIAAVSGVATVIPSGGIAGNPSGTILLPLAAGVPSNLLVRQVNTSGTTATGLVVIYQ